MLNRKKVPEPKALQKKETGTNKFATPTLNKRMVKPSLFPMELSTLNLVTSDPQQPGRFRFGGVKQLTEVTLVGRVSDVDIKDPSNLTFSLIDNDKQKLSVQIINDNLPDIPDG